MSAEVRELKSFGAGDFCRERSLGLAEPLAGTALEGVEHWLLVEDPSSWGPKPLKKNGFDAAVKNRLQEISDQPGWRVNLIRRPLGMNTATVTGLRLFASRLVTGDRRFLNLDLDSPKDLLDLDIGYLVRNAPLTTEDSSPNFFVCTHGLRDVCCAKWGMPLFQVMSGKLPGQVWQCSHLGGHRFAPNVLVMPYGLLYGRIELDQVSDFIAETVNRRIFDLMRLRGRVNESQVAQAAEIFLRLAMSERDIDAIRYESHRALGENRWRVDFSRALESRALNKGQKESEGPHKVYSIELERRQAERMRPVSCGDNMESNYSFFQRS